MRRSPDAFSPEPVLPNWCAAPAVTTEQPAAAAGRQLVVNLRPHNQTRSREMGSLLVEILDATNCGGYCRPDNSRPVPGYSLNDSVPVDCDTHAGVVRWGSGRDRLPAELPKRWKLRFVLTRARLYSFDYV